MNNINKSIEILERTPRVLHTLLYKLNPEWTQNNEGGETWSSYDVIGHLIHCDEENWIPRILVVLSDSEVRKFEPLDRLAQLEKSKGKNINQLLDDFVKIRFSSIVKLRTLNITDEQLSKTAIHPELGTVTLSQLISTWVVHDLDHISQISRVMAKQYKNEIGPWVQYMRVLNQ
ncbi:MAG: DinB family protein [Bacteroidetes bacterium]|nr:DinB family protein [Bacteroidota bacterium]